MWGELSDRQKVGLAGIALCAALTAGYWIGRSSTTKATPPLPASSSANQGPVAAPLEPAGKGKVVVDVKGEVRNPGVYEFAQGARVEDAVRSAGGGLESADWDSVNLARILQDGDQVVLKAKKAPLPAPAQFPIDINTAPVEDLVQIPGIGEGMAHDIIRWRSENGPIQNREDLERIPGFGPETVRQMEGYIRYF